MLKSVFMALCLVLFVAAFVLLPVVAFGQDSPSVTAPLAPAAPASSLWSTIWGFLNSPFGITLAATVGLAILNMIIKAAPKLATLLSTYRGDIIAAVKFAEKSIPDGSPNAGLSKLDLALKYAIRVIEEGEKRALTDAEVAAIKSNISEVHDDLEAVGTLSK